MSFKSYSPMLGGSRGHASHLVRNKCVRRASASLKTYSGNCCHWIGNLNAVSNWSGRVQHSTAKGKLGVITIASSRIKAASRIVFFLESCGVGYLTMLFLEVKYVGSLLNYLLDVYKQKSLSSSEQKSKLNHKNSDSPTIPRTPWMKGSPDPLEGGP